MSINQLILNRPDSELPPPIAGGQASGNLYDYLADYALVLGGDQAQSIANQAPNKTAQGVFVGAPTVLPTGVVCSPDAYVRTATKMGGALTIVAVLKNMVGPYNGKPCFGTYDFSTTKGLLVYTPGTTDLFVNGAALGNTPFDGNDQLHRMYMATHDGAGHYTLEVYGDGKVVHSIQGTRTTDALIPAFVKLNGMGIGQFGDCEFNALYAYPYLMDAATRLDINKALTRKLAAKPVGPVTVS